MLNIFWSDKIYATLIIARTYVYMYFKVLKNCMRMIQLIWKTYNSKYKKYNNSNKKLLKINNICFEWWYTFIHDNCFAINFETLREDFFIHFIVSLAIFYDSWYCCAQGTVVWVHVEFASHIVAQNAYSMQLRSKPTH